PSRNWRPPCGACATACAAARRAVTMVTRATPNGRAKRFIRGFYCYDTREVSKKQTPAQQLEAAKRTIFRLREELMLERAKRAEREEEVIALNHRLEEAGRDPLTNAMTRRAFDDHIRDVIAETYPDASVHSHQRRRKPRKQAIAVLLCDTDGFKGINDTYGHESG